LYYKFKFSGERKATSKPSPSGEGGSRRLTDEGYQTKFTENTSSVNYVDSFPSRGSLLVT
jgi:hypothetical protein